MVLPPAAPPVKLPDDPAEQLMVTLAGLVLAITPG